MPTNGARRGVALSPHTHSTFSQNPGGGKCTVAQTGEASQVSPRTRPTSIRGVIAQFYRANFAGRERNYFLWEALHQLLSAYDTIRIVATHGKCLRPEEL